MTVLYTVTRGDTIAGAQRNALQLAEAFSEDREVHIASTFAEGPFAQSARDAGIPFHPVEGLRPGSGPAGLRSAAKDLADLVRRVRPNLIHSHSTVAGLLSRAVAKRTGVGSVFTAHGWSFTEGVPVTRRGLGLVTEMACRPLGSHVICVSRVDMELGRRSRVVPASHLHHVPYGVPDLPRPAAPLPGDEPPVALMIARFEPQKDHATLVRALARITDIPWRVRFVGDGPLMAETEALARDLAISDRLDFVGFTPLAPDLLDQSDVFVLTTNYEGLPISILEALRAGRPVLASAVSGIPDAIRDGHNGILVQRGDVSSVANGLRRVFADAAWRKLAGERARALYEQEFTLDHMVDRVRAVYDRATKCRDAGSGRTS